MENGLNGEIGASVQLISVLMPTSQETGHVTIHHLKMKEKIVKEAALILLHVSTTAVQVCAIFTSSSE